MSGTRFDIAVIGGGIAGLSCAYFASPQRSVVVLERETALGYHSSGRSAAEFAFRFHGPMVGRLAAASFDFLTAPPPGFSEVALLKRRGNLLIADTEKAARLAEVFAAESAAAPGLERLTVDQALERAPILNRDYVVDAFFDPDCWDIEAENLLQGFAKGTRGSGGEIRTGSETFAARSRRRRMGARDEFRRGAGRHRRRCGRRLGRCNGGAAWRRPDRHRPLPPHRGDRRCA